MSWGTVVSPFPEQSAVCLPELHLQVHREGQEERKSDVERFTKLTTNRSNIAAILEISFCDQWVKHLQFLMQAWGEIVVREQEKLKSEVRWLLVSWPECYLRGAHHPAITIPQPDPLSQSLPRSISSCLTISASTSSRKGLSTPKISSISHPKISSWHVSQISPMVGFLFTDQHWPQNRNHNPPFRFNCMTFFPSF